MAYSQNTTIYYIPVFSQGDYSSGAENLKGMSTIDRHLNVAVQGLTDATSTVSTVVSEGSYSYAYDAGSSSFSVTLTALQALIGPILLSSTVSQTAWTGLAQNSTYYLFAQITENDPYTQSSRTNGSWVGVSNAASTPIANSVILAKIVTSTTTATLTSDLYNVTGKTYLVPRTGTATLSSGSYTVSGIPIAASTKIVLGMQTPSTPGYHYVSAKTTGASGSFTITSSNGSDASVVSYTLTER